MVPEHVVIPAPVQTHISPSTNLGASHPEDREWPEKSVDKPCDKKNSNTSSASFFPTGALTHVSGIGRRSSTTPAISPPSSAPRGHHPAQAGRRGTPQQKARFEKLFELAPEAIRPPRFRKTHRAVNRELRTSMDLLRKKRSAPISTDRSFPKARKSGKNRGDVKRGERVDADLTLQKKRRLAPYRVFSAANVKVEGNTPEIYGIYRDITDAQRAEEALSAAKPTGNGKFVMRRKSKKKILAGAIGSWSIIGHYFE